MTEDASTAQDFIYNLAASSAFDAGEGGVCFAARNSGLYRSDDGGKTWSLATASLGIDQTLTATAVAADLDHDHTVICGLSGGMLVSGDDGKTWGLPKIPPPPPMITALALSPRFAQDGVALAGTMQDGVLRSADHGRSWTIWNFGLLDLSVLSLAISPDFSRDETIFAGTETGIFRSTNGGRAWREVDLPVGYDPVLSLGISPAFAKDGVIYAGTETKGLLVSLDGGDHWTVCGEQFADQPINALVVWLGKGKAANAEVIALSEGLAWISRDGGSHWSQLWPELQDEGMDISALHAPAGFQPGSPAWVGLYGGEVILKNF